MGLEQMLRLAIPKTGKFRFRCTGCGACCYGQDIHLSPFDVGRMADKLGIPRSDFLSLYTGFALDARTGFPIITLRMRDEDSGCVLLDGTKCRVHDAKPSVCALFPLGRAMAANGDECEPLYFLRPVSCGANDEVHTPEEWMASLWHAGGEEELAVWLSVVKKLSPLTAELLRKLGAEWAAEVERSVCFLLYCCSPPKVDVSRQLMENASFAKKKLEIHLAAADAAAEESPPQNE